MPTALYVATLMRAELQRTRSMATALGNNLGRVLDNADRIVPFALNRIDGLLADDVLRLLGCLQGAQELQAFLGEDQIAEMALSGDCAIEKSAHPASARCAWINADESWLSRDHTRRDPTLPARPCPTSDRRKRTHIRRTAQACTMALTRRKACR
jgi:hypothetical protein